MPISSLFVDHPRYVDLDIGGVGHLSGLCAGSVSSTSSLERVWETGLYLKQQCPGNLFQSFPSTA